jgi:hypothetical protein
MRAAIGVGVDELDAEERLRIRDHRVAVQIAVEVAEREPDVPAIAVPGAAAVGIGVAKLAARVVSGRRDRPVALLPGL